MLYARACATAIAAALALCSTSALAKGAQQTQPTSTDPVSTPAVPAVDSSPVSIDSGTPLATQADTATSSTITTKKATKRRVTHVAAAAPTPVATRTVSRTKTHAAPQPVAPAAPIATAQTPQSAVKPIVDVNNKPAKSTAQAQSSRKKDDTPVIAAGGVLAFLALGGAAVGLARRRREDEETMEGGSLSDERSAAAPGPERRDPLFEEETARNAPEVSAFSWGKSDGTVEQSSRRPGETWVERAYRGPSADNPSLSLRKRLKRAAFFDQRDRAVAAGTAKAVDTDAGLPEAMADERELETL